MAKRKSKKRDNSKKRPLGPYATYSSIGIQMVIIILAGAFGGRELDTLTGWKFPVFTIVLTLLALVLAMIYFMKEIFNKNK